MSSLAPILSSSVVKAEGYDLVRGKTGLVAAQFTAGADGTVSAVEVALVAVSSNGEPRPFEVLIYPDQNGQYGGTTVFTGQGDAASGYFHAVKGKGATKLVKGHKYWVVVVAPVNDPSHALRWLYVASSVKSLVVPVAGMTPLQAETPAFVVLATP